MGALLVALALARAIAATPIGNPALWVTTEDYPSLALRNEWEGRVAFHVDIRVDGSPQNCVIDQTSGHQILDEAACTMILNRAHFSPARDNRGRAVPSRYSSAVRWQLPQMDAVPFKAGHRRLRLTFDGDGEVERCTSEGEGASLADWLGGDGCSETEVAWLMKVMPYFLDDDPSLFRIVTIDFHRLLGSSVAPPLPVAANVTLTQTYTLSVAPDGRLVGCVIKARRGAFAERLDLCVVAFRSPHFRFSPATGAEARRVQQIFTVSAERR